MHITQTQQVYITEKNTFFRTLPQLNNEEGNFLYLTCHVFCKSHERSILQSRRLMAFASGSDGVPAVIQLCLVCLSPKIHWIKIEVIIICGKGEGQPLKRMIRHLGQKG